MKQKIPLVNKYKQPLGSPADKTTNVQQKYVGWKFGTGQEFRTKKIRSSTGFFKTLSAGAVGSVTSITGGTINQSTVNMSTIVNSNFQGTVSQPIVSGGTFTNPTVNTGTFNTSLFGGTFNNGVLGTPTITGGTANFGTYQTGGTGGVSGSIVYLKTTAPTFGTLQFLNGLIIAFT